MRVAELNKVDGKKGLGEIRQRRAKTDWHGYPCASTNESICKVNKILLTVNNDQHLATGKGKDRCNQAL